jgi:hypothetical protein
METLLVVAIIITALPIVVQAGVLVAMYMMSKEVAANVDGLVSESRRMLAPLENVAHNMKSASEDMAVVGKIAVDQMNHVALMVEDSHVALAQFTTNVSEQISEAVEEIRTKVTDPFRRGSAILSGIREGVRVLFRGRVEPAESREYPAA